MPRTRKDLVYLILGGFFLTNAILGELTGGKLFALHLPAWLGGDAYRLILPIGVLPWPVVFITTDLVNEYFGKAGVRRLTLLTAVMIGYSFVVLYLAIGVPAWEQSPVPDHAFRTVFGQSQWIIVGSLAAFLVSQLVDVLVFVAFKSRTGHRMLWLRATGSTLVSQVVDTFVVGTIAFVIPGKLTLSAWLPVAAGSYLFKVGMAVVITPLIYIGHGVIDRFLAADVRPAEPDLPA